MPLRIDNPSLLFFFLFNLSHSLSFSLSHLQADGIDTAKSSATEIYDNFTTLAEVREITLVMKYKIRTLII
jgi:hypothetical protein